MMRALITGINGFVACHLARHLLRQGWQVAGLTHTGMIDTPELRGRVQPVAADLRDPAATRVAVEASSPEVIFHLAAQSHVPTSQSDPIGTISNNLLGQLNLLEAVRALGKDLLVVVACTSDEYGIVRPDELPIDEDTPLRPNNPYAISKVAQDMLALQYFLGYRVRTVRLRLFNHIGPGQNTDFVVPSFSAQIARIEAGLQEPVIRVGNLDVQRDFTDVRDVVRAYELAALRGEPGAVYNIGTGRPVAIREILSMLVASSTVSISIEPDPERIRPVDVPVVACDSSRFRSRTGWQPEIPLEQSLADILAEVRGRGVA